MINLQHELDILMQQRIEKKELIDEHKRQLTSLDADIYRLNIEIECVEKLLKKESVGSIDHSIDDPVGSNSRVTLDHILDFLPEDKSKAKSKSQIHEEYISLSGKETKPHSVYNRLVAYEEEGKVLRYKKGRMDYWYLNQQTS